MKSLKLIVLFVLGVVTMSFAQVKPVEKAVIKTPTVQCEMCKDRLEKFLARETGVTAYKVDYKKKTVTVTYITDRTNLENIKTAIANAGYDADDVTADEDAYKRLPKCCQKPAPAVADSTKK